MNNLNRRDFIRAACSAVSLAAIHPLALLAANVKPKAHGPTAIDPLTLVNPELRPAMEARLKAGPQPTNITTAQLAAIRKAGEQHHPQWLSQPPVVERKVPVRTGIPDVTVYTINAQRGAARPAILHTHGGGFILGSARDSVPQLQTMAKTLDCVIVTVEYGLAPETRLPTSLEQNYAALKWLHSNATELGVDRSRIAVSGESAGGGHAAMLAITARNGGEIPIIFQSLVYPMLDDRTGTIRNPPPYIGTFTWIREYNRLGWTSLLGHPPAPTLSTPGPIPSRESNLRGLPPTWIGVGSLDLFIDEDLDYAHRLIDAAVPTELLVIPGAYHGFDGLVPNASVTKQFNNSRLTALARAFGAKLNLG
jgi:acetyl esterase/lipase